MKRFYKFLMPLVMIMALALPWQMRAQDTLTVANGTETNSYIPIYGLWTDEAQHNQILYPASMLDDMSGSAVTQLTWYMSSPASSAWGTTVTIKMTEVSATSLSGHLPTTDATTVWTGVVNGTSSPITITFDVPYVYTGSNLLIDVTTTAATYSSCSWYGVSQSNASYYQYSSSTGSQSFLPKTTFVYSPASNICMPPTNVAATVTGSDADITWTEGDGSAWEIVWGVGAFNPDTVTINADYASSGSYSLTNLPDGPYNVYVRTDCGNNEYSVWRSLSFYINANGCMIGINGSDSYGDGWNGGSLAIVQGGNTVATFTLSTGSSASATYPVTGSMPVNFVWSSGSFDSEVSFSIIDGGGATVYSVSNPSTGTVYTMTDPCPTCFAPQGLEVVTLTPDSITFTWLPGGDETAWEVSNGIDTIEIYDTVYTFGGLTSNTIYTLSVRSICDVDDTSAWMSINVRTACTFIDSLPYTTSFEDASTGSYTSFTFGDPCWTLTTDATEYPYVYVSSSSSYAHSGSKGIYWYRSSSTGTYGTYQCLVMPGVAVDEDHPITDLQLKFWAKASSSSYHPIFQVGVMTNPGDINTFTTVGTVDINGVTDWTEYVVGLNGYTGTGNFVAIRANNIGSYWYAYVDDFTLEVAPSCPPITHIYTEGTSTSGAYLTWTLQEGLSGVPEEYEIEYVATDDSTATVATATTTDPYIFLSGLTPNTEYKFRVRVDCGDDDYAPWDSTTFKTANFGCLVFDSATVDTLAITGGSASTSYYIPIGNYYNYSYTQQLILASEMNGGSNLTGIDFQYTGSSASTAKTNATIYLANVSTSSLSSSFVPYDASTFVPVYTGALNCTVGWNHFEFDTPFPYDGTSNLLIVVHDNSGDYDGSSSYSFTTHSASGMSRYVQNDGSAYNINTVSGGTSYAYRVNMKLYGGTCQTTATCAAPVAGAVNIDSTSVTVGWAPGADETSWDLYYRIYGDSVWTSAATGVTATSYNYTNLNPGTKYEFRVSNNCSEGDFSTVVSATTACAAFHLPLTENFEVVPSGVFEPQCWVNGSTYLGSTYPNPIVVSLTGDPNKLLLFYNGGYLILPQVAAPLNQLQVRFKFVQGGDNVRFLMGLMPNQDLPIDSIIVLDTLVRSDIDTSTSTVFITHSLATINPDYNNYHLAFWDAFNENYSFIDDLVVEYIPQCASVSGLSATATTNTATISWTVDGDNASSYIIEYGPRGFQLGTGTTTIATSSPATITGLAHSTNYDAYVYTICAALNDTSTVSPVVEFATECDVITTLPYSTTFEHILPPGSGSSVVMVPNCWATEVVSTGTAPRIYYTTTAAMAPSPSYCLYFYNIGVAALPQMSMPLDSVMLSFHAYNSTPASYGLIIGAVDSITPGYAASFTPIDTVVFQYGNNNEYNLVSFLTNYNGSANHLAIRNYNVDSTATYATIYLDNLTVDYIPSCIAPQRVHTSMLTNVAADLEWTISNAPNYSIEYGPHGFTPGTGTPLTSTTNSVSLTGLTPLTQYDVRLVSLCSATETSDTTVFTFTTLRAAPVTNYPYYCDFADSAIAAGWEPVNGTQANAWYVGSGAHYGTADNMAMYISNDNGVSNTYNVSSTSNVLAYRTFAMQPGSYNINFMWQAAGESCCDYMRVFLVPGTVNFIANETNGIASTGAPAGWIALDGGNKLNSNSSWQNIAEDVTITSTGNYHLVFFWHNDGSIGTNPPAAVDNIEVTRNVCPIIDLQVDTATGSTITISWTGNSDSYQVEYGTPGFAHGTGISTTTTATSATLTGLTSLTNYEIYVRGFCNGSDTSRWYRTIGSTGLCDNPTMATNWDTTMTGGVTSSYSPIGYSFYNYSYTQTIIDSAQMAEIGGDVTAFAYYPSSTTAGSYFSNMDVYMANVPESNLTAGFIHPDSTNHVFVQVLAGGDLSYTTAGEHIVSFDVPFTWDGHSNVLFAVNRKHGSYSSGATFASHTQTAGKMRYAYQDSPGAFDINTVANGYATATAVGDIKLISCGAGCAVPSAMTASNVTYNAATITWSGSDSTEIGIHEGLWDETGVNFVTVTNGTYTFTGLAQNTQYTVAARTLCEDNMTSNWSYVTFTTEELPCFAPTNIQVSNETPNGGKITWTPGGNETEWLVNVFRTGVIDTNITVINTPMCNVSGLYADMTYTVRVASVCGGIETVWCDSTATLTTTACLPPTDVTAVANGHNAMVTWTSSGANEYHVLWYLEGFTTGADSVVVENGTTNATITGLQQSETYDIYVYAYCDGQRSAQAGQTQVTITGIDDVNSSLINLYPNPANTTVTVDGIQGEAIVTIVDMNGRTVFSEKAVGKLTIDLGGMAQGAYFVRITGENTTAIRKLIVK